MSRVQQLYDCHNICDITQKRAIIDVAVEMTALSREELTKLLDPQVLAKNKTVL